MTTLLRWGVVTLPRRRHLAVLAVAAAALASCSGTEESVAPTTVPATTTTVRPSVVTDGRLVIGVMVPASDSLVSEPVLGAVETAVDRINEAGGVLERPVRLVTAEEGSTTASATAAIQTLVDRQVDAIVGPASSLVALGTLDEIIAAGKVSCSPTASAMALDDFPNRSLFFRTVPSDSLQAAAIAQTADQTGAQRATIVYVDDAYGRAFQRAVESDLELGSISVVDSIPFRSDDDDLSDEMARLTRSDAQVAIVLAAGDAGTRFLAAMDDGDTSQFSNVVVNDALRDPSSPQRIQDLDDEFRNKIVGLAPLAESADQSKPFDPPGLFAANAFDCVNLLALATVLADSDAPQAIANEMFNVSSSGSPCGSFADCVEATDEGLQINYDGPSGLTELEPRGGDPEQAVFVRFTLDEDGNDVVQRTVTVGG